MTIGQRIAELRRQNNLSQEALGEALGVTRQSISKWESDGALPEIEKLVAMSRLFGVSVGALLGVEEETPAEGTEPGKTRQESELSEKRPSTSVVVPTVPPLTSTVAPTTGLPAV